MIVACSMPIWLGVLCLGALASDDVKVADHFSWTGNGYTCTLEPHPRPSHGARTDRELIVSRISAASF